MSDAIEKRRSGSFLPKALRYGGIVVVAAAPLVARGEGGAMRFALAAIVGVVVFVLGAWLGRPPAR